MATVIESPQLGAMTFEVDAHAWFLDDSPRRDRGDAAFEALAPAIRFAEGRVLLDYAFRLQSIQGLVGMALDPGESAGPARVLLDLPLVAGSAEIKLFPRPSLFDRGSEILGVGARERLLSFRSGGATVSFWSLEHSVTFGSRREERRGIVRGSAPLLLLLAGAGAGAMASTHYAEWQENRRIEKSIEHEIGSSRCQTNIGFTLDYGQLRQRAVTTADWKDPAVSDIERMKRICRTQLLLRLAGHPPGPLDGDWGVRSQAAWDSFVTAHGIAAMGREEQLEKLAIEAAGKLRST